METLNGAAVQRAEQNAANQTPQAVLSRVKSRTRFRRLSRRQAVLAVKHTFSTLATHVEDEAPHLASGQRILRYKGSFLAETELGGHQRGLVASLAPMATVGPNKEIRPTSLTLQKTGDDFEPEESAAPVLIPANLAEGVQASVDDVSLVPLRENGQPVSDIGESNGASVTYPNTAADTDIVAKPTSTGYELAAILRSPDSPRIQRYRVVGPSGMQLAQPSATAPVEVLLNGARAGMIAPPTATDATGMSVPASMAVEGNLLAVSVDPSEADQWPVAVDPTWYYVNDTTLPVAGGAQTNWREFHSPAVAIAYGPTPGAYVWASSSNAGEIGGLGYEPQGDTQIYYAEDETSASLAPAESSSVEQFYNKKKQGNVYSAEIGRDVSYSNLTDYLCQKPIYNPCAPEANTPESVFNDNEFDLYGVAGYSALSNGWWFSIQKVKLYMAEEHGTEAYFNTSSQTLGEAGARTNVLAGPNRWMGRYTGAFEIKARNPGMGVSLLGVEEQNAGSFKVQDENHELGKCRGELCPLEDVKAYSYTPALSDGEDKLRMYADGSDNNWVEETKIVKVDATPPERLEASGWPENNEIGPVASTLTIKASDGTQPTPSSGIKTVGVSIDGRPAKILPEANCTPGPCTAEGSYSLRAGNLPEGVHRLVITATDNAANEAQPVSMTFDVRRPTTVSVGPGTVEPTSGQFDLTTTDASLASGTSITRTYRSEEIPAAGAGVLGTQWSLSLGTSESLTVSPDGSVALSSADRSRTSFEPTGALTFESPKGDSSLKLVAKESIPGKGVTEYVTSDESTGTSVTFTQPEGTAETSPEFAGEFGAEGVTMKPEGAAVDAAGDIWVTDAENSRLLEFDQAGVLKRQIGRYGTESGALRRPTGIAINQTSGNLYVADAGNNRIDEFDHEGHFLEAFGVLNGQTAGICTTNCKAGSAPQSKPVGAISEPTAVAIDSSANVWVADKGYNRLEEFKSGGEAITSIGAPGSGAGQLKYPTGIAYANSDLYVSERENARIQVLTTSGAFVREFGKAGSGTGELANPGGIAAETNTGRLYASDAQNAIVREYSPTGALIATFGGRGAESGELAEPAAVAVGAKGIFLVDTSKHAVQDWARTRWLPSKAERPGGSLASSSDYGPLEIESGKVQLVPKELLAPTPPGITCGTLPAELKQGCRALLLEYTTTAGTASGEEESQWGTYRGRLRQVQIDLYVPKTKAMEKIPVAEYAYDNHGRLRAEWDPRVTPKVLKTKYGYDEEGHLTALTPPGQQSWELSYGTTAGDATGRLLKLTHGPAGSQLWNGSPAANSESPAISGTASVGSRLKASVGKWSNEPNEALAFGYQWVRCNEAGAECTPIPGAVNETYTAIVPDAKHRLGATVFATNGAGTKSAHATPTQVIAGSTFAFTQTFGSAGTIGGDFAKPSAVAIAPNGNVWVADPGNRRLQELTSEGQFLETIGWGVTDGKEEFERCTANCRAGLSGGGAGEFSDPEGIGINQQTGRLYVADAAQSRVDILTASGSPLNTFASYGNYEQLKYPHGVSVAADGSVWVADSGNGHVVKFNAEGEYETQLGRLGSGPGEFQELGGLTVSGLHVYVTDIERAKVMEFVTTGQHELIAEFGQSGTGKGQFTYPVGITYDSLTEQLLVTSYGDGRIESYSASGTAGEEFGQQGTGNTNFNGPDDVAINPSTGAAYIADQLNNRVAEWTPGGVATEPVQPPPAAPRGSVTTIDYGVPTAGTGIEHSLTAPETKTWGQEADLPLEGTAIFPPSKPMGWPAASYEGATITYLDARSRAVNTVTRAGGVTTTEYNNENLVTRTLGASNRAAALAQGEGVSEKSAAAARTLDTKDAYSEGALIETQGPQHAVTVERGHENLREDVTARALKRFTYDPTTNLPLKVEEAAKVASGTEYDKRVTVDGYDGQGGLGWTLRKPTSVTVDPEHANRTTTTEYDPTTGQVTAVTLPGNSRKAAPLYTWNFGPTKTPNPSAIAADEAGDAWIVNTSANRIDEYSKTGAFLKGVGWGVADGKAEDETCASECKTGLAGNGQGEFNSPHGIAYDAKSKSLYVADTNNNRVELLTNAGAFKRGIGSIGAGQGQLSAPRGVSAQPDGSVWIADTGNSRLEEFTEKGKYVAQAGNGAAYTSLASCGEDLYVPNPTTQRIDVYHAESLLKSIGGTGKEGGDIAQIGGIACDGAAEEIYVSDEESDDVAIFTPGGAFINTFGAPGAGTGQVSQPGGLSVAGDGTTYVIDGGNNRISEWAPSAEGAHTSRTAYYTAGNEASVKACRKHPEWAALPCQIEPSEQPGTASLPAIPTSEVKYNVWDEPETVTEAFGATDRTRTTEYDAAGRVTTAITTAPGQTAISTADRYNEATGELETVSSTTEGKTETETTKDNSTGSPVAFIDNHKAETTLEYEPSGEERLVKISDATGAQAYTYDPRSGFRTGETISGLGEITATYTIEGKLATETFPNHLTARTEHDATGGGTAITYERTASCAHSCPETWYADKTKTSIYDEKLEDTTTFSTAVREYDDTGRLLESTERPANGGCTARLYAYDEASNRTQETTRQAATGSTCPTSGGSTTTHVYDSAGRLDDPGVSYEQLDNIVTTPATDAESHEIKASYYADGQVATTSQAGTALSYAYGPTGRESTITATGAHESTVTYHYSGGQGSPSWSEEGANVTRYISGLGGELAATITSGHSAEITIHDMAGDIVATASANEAEKALHEVFPTTESGAPINGHTPPRFSWQAEDGMQSNYAMGVTVNVQSGSAYIPQLGRTLQSAPVEPPGACPSGCGHDQPREPTLDFAGVEAAEAIAQQIVAEELAAHQRAEEEEACRADPDACSEDPSWSGDISIHAAEFYSAALESAELPYYVSGAAVIEQVVDLLAEKLHINFITKVKEALEKGIFGYSADDVAQWAFKLGGELRTCTEEAVSSGFDPNPSNPHCWVDFPTKVRHAYKGSPGTEVPDFDKALLTVDICPWGKNSKCFWVE
jgi:DNA-binding beta-propeller fold protein YncE